MKVVITRAFICKRKVLRIGLASSRRKKTMFPRGMSVKGGFLGFLMAGH